MTPIFLLKPKVRPRSTTSRTHFDDDYTFTLCSSKGKTIYVSYLFSGGLVTLWNLVHLFVLQTQFTNEVMKGWLFTVCFCLGLLEPTVSLQTFSNLEETWKTALLVLLRINSITWIWFLGLCYLYMVESLLRNKTWPRECPRTVVFKF